MSSQAQSQQSGPVVRPRLIWTGVTLAIVAMLVAGVANVAGSLLWFAIGVVVTAIALALAFAGGVMYDVHQTDAADQEDDEVEQGGVRTGVAPSDRIQHSGAQRTSVEKSNAARERIAEAESTPSPPMRPTATVALLALAGWIFIGQYLLGYPHTPLGQRQELLESGVAVTVVLSAVWLRFVGPNLAATGLCMLAGLALVVSGAFLADPSLRIQANEAATGLLVLACAAGTLGRDE